MRMEIASPDVALSIAQMASSRGGDFGDDAAQPGDSPMRIRPPVPHQVGGQVGSSRGGSYIAVPSSGIQRAFVRPGRPASRQGRFRRSRRVRPEIAAGSARRPFEAKIGKP